MNRRLAEGLVQVYTGNGKGKTTAALGLALRAAGAGMKVYIHQFVKNARYSEIASLEGVKNIVIEQSGRGCFIRGKPKVSDIECARNGLWRASKRIASGKFSVVILDEVNIALSVGLVDADELINIIRDRPKGVEVVLTGRSCPRRILKCADLITEMRSVRHPYDRGVVARRGIEY